MAPERKSLSFFFFVKENQFIFKECNSIFGSFTCVLIGFCGEGGNFASAKMSSHPERVVL